MTSFHNLPSPPKNKIGLACNDFSSFIKEWRIVPSAMSKKPSEDTSTGDDVECLKTGHEHHQRERRRRDLESIGAVEE